MQKKSTINATELIIRYRSFVGILCLIVVLIIATPEPVSLFIGFILIIIGIFFRAWSSGHINKDKELATNGPYSLTRNPLYFGSFILGIGIAVACNNLCTYTMFFVYYLLFFPFLIYIERKRLRNRFGKTYDDWATKSNLFFPKLKRAKNSDFNISYYIRNREYRVLFFSLLVIAFLIVKYLYQIRKV